MIFRRRKAKVGIAFGGGGARGFAHLGAIKAFEQFGIKFDFIAGTSAGSLVGEKMCCHLPHQSLMGLLML